MDIILTCDGPDASRYDAPADATLFCCPLKVQYGSSHLARWCIIWLGLQTLDVRRLSSATPKPPYHHTTFPCFPSHKPRKTQKSHQRGRRQPAGSMGMARQDDYRRRWVFTKSCPRASHEHQTPGRAFLIALDRCTPTSAQAALRVLTSKVAIPLQHALNSSRPHPSISPPRPLADLQPCLGRPRSHVARIPPDFQDGGH